MELLAPVGSPRLAECHLQPVFHWVFRFFHVHEENTVFCPSCGTEVLERSELEQGLFTMGCPQCGGHLINLSSYDGWIKSTEAMAVHAAGDEVFDISNSRHAIHCPKCQRIMVKFRVAADTARSLDFCFACDEVWLDNGEWESLKARKIHTRIRSVSTDAWQHRIREVLSEKSRVEHFRQQLGDEVFQTAEEFNNWLEGQPARAVILRYLISSAPLSAT